MAGLGRWLIIIGVVIAILGGIVWLLSKIPGVNNFPGTIRIEGAGFTCLIPILASIVISVVLTVLLNLLIRFFNK